MKIFVIRRKVEGKIVNFSGIEKMNKEKNG